ARSRQAAASLTSVGIGRARRWSVWFWCRRTTSAANVVASTAEAVALAFARAASICPIICASLSARRSRAAVGFAYMPGTQAARQTAVSSAATWGRGQGRGWGLFTEVSSWRSDGRHRRLSHPPPASAYHVADDAPSIRDRLREPPPGRLRGERRDDPVGQRRQ